MTFYIQITCCTSWSERKSHLEGNGSSGPPFSRRPTFVRGNLYHHFYGDVSSGDLGETGVSDITLTSFTRQYDDLKMTRSTASPMHTDAYTTNIPSSQNAEEHALMCGTSRCSKHSRIRSNSGTSYPWLISLDLSVNNEIRSFSEGETVPSASYSTGRLDCSLW